MNKFDDPTTHFDDDDDVRLIGNVGFSSYGVDSIREYFTIDENRRPMRTHLDVDDDVLRGNGVGEGGGIIDDVDDFVELPADV